MPAWAASAWLPHGKLHGHLLTLVQLGVGGLVFVSLAALLARPLGADDIAGFIEQRCCGDASGRYLRAHDPQQRDQLRKELIDRLTVIYRAVRADLSAIIVGAALEPDAEDEAEEGAADELRALAASLEDRDRQLAHSIEDALRRMRSDTYGVCIDCGREIPVARLRAVPWTLRCADDEARVEGTTPHATL